MVPLSWQPYSGTGNILAIAMPFLWVDPVNTMNHLVPYIDFIYLHFSEMFNEWTVELKAMADRIISMREQLFDALKSRGTPGDWSHIIKQIGMFTFTGLNSEQVAFMRQEYHMFMTSDGRISMAVLNMKNLPHLADAIHAAVTKLK